ncbi:MAG: ATP-grasp domain-containing protein [Defluviitaleaceae bacterium]|nr:ATP-grasp domain-containing protein [Defluviitaleaceae bacterium]
MLILFPAECFNNNRIEPDYADEYETVCQFPYFKTLFFNFDEFIANRDIKLFPRDHYNGDCIYRGWMINPEKYKKLYKILLNAGIKLINTPDEYNNCHLFPSVLDMLAPYTPKSLCFEDSAFIDWDLVNGSFKKFMVKDYVKSVKGTVFPAFFNTPVKKDEMDRQILEFIRLRDDLFTNGIVLKEFVELKRYGEATNEYRAFFMNGQLLSLCRNSNQPSSSTFVPLDFVSKFSWLKSNYYTVDMAELTDGTWTVIETGDGQVSGLSPNQCIHNYYNDIQNILSKPSC